MDTHKKFGITEKPIQCTRVLVKPLDASHFAGKKADAILAINDKDGTVTAANVYGQSLGEKYNPKFYKHEIPAKDSGKWADWTSKGYKAGNVEDFEVLELVEIKAAVGAAK